MVTTRDLEQEVESALLDAGASDERARAAASALGDEIVQLATKSDLDQGLKDLKSELRAEMREMRQDLHDRMDQIERTMWRLAMLGFAMWSATFGALMYAVFG
ncbi:MAG: hypothetical protein OXD50_13630 [Chloroflexi bacterium]|nr:hypothetical protein [Chloroflexota bacterium]